MDKICYEDSTWYRAINITSQYQDPSMETKKDADSKFHPEWSEDQGSRYYSDEELENKSPSQTLQGQGGSKIQKRIRKKQGRQCPNKNHPKNFGLHLRSHFEKIVKQNKAYQSNEAIIAFIGVKNKSNANYTFDTFNKLFVDDQAFKISQNYFKGALAIQSIVSAEKLQDKIKMLSNIKAFIKCGRDRIIHNF